MFSLYKLVIIVMIYAGRNAEGAPRPLFHAARLGKPEISKEAPSTLSPAGNESGLFGQSEEDLAGGRKKKKKVGFFVRDSLFHPYWFDGEWVYKRTTMKPYKRVPLPPHRSTKKLPKNTTDSTTTTRTTSSRSTTTKFVDYNCQHPCPLLFEQYGEVCGQRFHGYEYEMRQFRDICDLYAENCINPYIKNNYEDPRRGQWRVLYRGSCHELTTEYIYSPTNVPFIVGRAQNITGRIKAALTNFERILP